MITLGHACGKRADGHTLVLCQSRLTGRWGRVGSVKNPIYPLQESVRELFNVEASVESVVRSNSVSAMDGSLQRPQVAIGIG